MAELSIVVAAKNSRRTIQQCLESLVQQNEGGMAEILVIDASTDTSAEIARGFKDVNVIQVDPDCLIPELWKWGIERSSGRAVAFTTAHFIPDRNWIAQIGASLKGDHAAVGGVFDKRTPDALSQWAIFFIRYAAYLPPVTSHTASQLAADNAAYKRWVFERYDHLIKEGFWEHPINRQLVRDGYTLLLTPALRVLMGYFSPPGDFFRQRFTHGRVFGAERAAQAGAAQRLLYVITSPFIPVVLLQRVVRQVIGKKAHLGKFFLSLPWVLFYMLGWSMGELSGYLAGKTPVHKLIQDGFDSKNA